MNRKDNQGAVNVVTETIDLTSHAARKALIKAIIKLFDLWGLSPADRLNLLGLSPKSRSMLSRYTTGSIAPSSRKILDRMEWLLVIHKSLRILYPHPDNKDLLYSWIKRRNKAFGDKTALDVMKEQGIDGMRTAARYLDQVIMH